MEDNKECLFECVLCTIKEIDELKVLVESLLSLPWPVDQRYRLMEASKNIKEAHGLLKRFVNLRFI